MRTRIALVAITSIALITVTILTQAASVQPARASIRRPPVTVTHRTSHLTVVRETETAGVHAGHRPADSEHGQRTCWPAE